MEMTRWDGESIEKQGLPSLLYSKTKRVEVINHPTAFAQSRSPLHARIGQHLTRARIVVLEESTCISIIISTMILEVLRRPRRAATLHHHLGPLPSITIRQAARCNSGELSRVFLYCRMCTVLPIIILNYTRGGERLRTC